MLYGEKGVAMAQDLELINQLEKETGKKLNKYSLDYNGNRALNFFIVDPEGDVVEMGPGSIRNMAALISTNP